MRTVRQDGQNSNYDSRKNSVVLRFFASCKNFWNIQSVGSKKLNIDKELWNSKAENERREKDMCKVLQDQIENQYVEKQSLGNHPWQCFAEYCRWQQKWKPSWSRDTRVTDENKEGISRVFSKIEVFEIGVRTYWKPYSK